MATAVQRRPSSDINAISSGQKGLPDKAHETAGKVHALWNESARAPDASVVSLAPEQVRAELERVEAMRQQLEAMRAKLPEMQSHANLNLLFATMARSMVVMQNLVTKLEDLDSQERQLHKVVDEKERKDREHALILDRQRTASAFKTGISLFLSAVNIAGGIITASTGAGVGIGAAMIASGAVTAINTVADQLQLYEKACQAAGMKPDAAEKTCSRVRTVTTFLSWGVSALSAFFGGTGAVSEATDAAMKGAFGFGSAVGAASSGLAGARLSAITAERVEAESDMLVLGQQFTEGQLNLQELQSMNQALMEVQSELTQLMASIPNR